MDISGVAHFKNDILSFTLDITALRPTQPPVQLVPFPGGKVRPGRNADPSPHSSAEVKNRVELYLYSP